MHFEVATFSTFISSGGKGGKVYGLMGFSSKHHIGANIYFCQVVMVYDVTKRFPEIKPKNQGGFKEGENARRLKKFFLRRRGNLAVSCCMEFTLC